MKKLINTTLLLACLAGTGFISSCSKSDSGTGCPAWHEGDNCQMEMREKFYGTYVGPLTDVNGKVLAQYTVTLSAGAGGVQNVHLAFIGGPVVWEMLLTSSTTLNVPVQYITAFTPNYTDQGSGSISGNTLTLKWTQKLSTGQSYDWTFVGVR